MQPATKRKGTDNDTAPKQKPNEKRQRDPLCETHAQTKRDCGHLKKTSAYPFLRGLFLSLTCPWRESSSFFLFFSLLGSFCHVFAFFARRRRADRRTRALPLVRSSFFPPCAAGKTALSHGGLARVSARAATHRSPRVPRPAAHRFLFSSSSFFEKNQKTQKPGKERAGI